MPNEPKDNQPSADELETEVDRMMNTEKTYDESQATPSSTNNQPTSPKLADDATHPSGEAGEQSEVQPTAPELTDDAAQANLQAASRSEEANDPETATSQISNTADNFDDEKTAKAIKDINKQDSDTILSSEDVAKSDINEKPPKDNLLKRWWKSKPWRYGTILFILALIITTLAVPTSRFWVLNQFGVRAEITLTTIDSKTKQPLKHVSVSVDGQHKLSTRDGLVKFTDVRLGEYVVKINKPAFADAKQNITVNYGQNNLGKINLKAVGVQYTFELSDYLSAQPIAGAEVSLKQASAQSDVKGKAILNLMDTNVKERKITIKAAGYNTKVVTVASDKHHNNIQLTPEGQDYFVSQSSGKYSLYSSNLDGSKRKLLLKASGNESADQELAVNDGGKLVALVNHRDDKHGVNGKPLKTLTVVNTKTKLPLTLDHAASIQLIGWLDGETLVYVTISDCKSGSCYQLNSYNYSNSSNKQLASANGFSAALAINNRVYYATTRNYQDKDSQPKFVAINSDGTNKEVLLKEDVYSVYRSTYNKLLLAASGKWYSYTAGDSKVKKTATPSNPASRQYADSPDDKRAAWIDQRDGQSVILIHDRSTNKDKTIASLSGVKYPIRWLDNNTLIFRVKNASGTANYVLSLTGNNSKPKKISNVTDIAGANGFYY